MENKVFWGYNAQELKTGSSGYFADRLVELERLVKEGRKEDIKGFDRADCGAFKPVNEPIYYNFFALVADPVDFNEIKLQNTIKELQRRYSLYDSQAEDFAHFLIDNDLMDWDEDSEGDCVAPLFPDITEYGDYEDIARKYFDNHYNDDYCLSEYIDYDAWGHQIINEGGIHDYWWKDSDGNPWGIN